MNYGTIVLIKLSLLYLHLPFHPFFLLSLSLSLPLSSTLVLGNKYSSVATLEISSAAISFPSFISLGLLLSSS